MSGRRIPAADLRLGRLLDWSKKDARAGGDGCGEDDHDRHGRSQRDGRSGRGQADQPLIEGHATTVSNQALVDDEPGEHRRRD